MLKALEYKKLNLNETLDLLQNGGVVVVRGVESTTKGDILVRLDPRTVPVTQVSHDIGRGGDSEYFKPYWVVFDLPFNYFVTRDVLEFTEDYRLYSPKYQVGDVVGYTYDNGLTLEKDTAIVNKVFVDVDETGTNTYYYNLSRVENNVREDMLTKI